jgi:hypothetical protein
MKAAVVSALAPKRGKSESAADKSEKRLLRAYRLMPAEARATMLRVAESYEKEAPRHKAPALRIVSASSA